MNTDEGVVAEEEEEELEEAKDISEEVEGDSLDEAVAVVAAPLAEPFPLSSTSSFDLVFSDLRPFSRSSLFIGPDDDFPATAPVLVLVLLVTTVMAPGSSSQLRAFTSAD